MTIWIYKILSGAGTITTKNTEYAEKKSKLGCIVFCKRESNIFKLNHN